MNWFKSSAKLPSRKRERDLRHNEFHTLLLGVAGRDPRQGVRVIRSTDEWLSSMLSANADKQRLQLGESVVGRLTEQLDRLAGALRLYENTVTMEPSPVPLRLCSTAVRQNGLRPNRAMIISSAGLLGGVVRNLARNAMQIYRQLFRKLWQRRGGAFSPEG
jgi:hypothetical protein